MNAGRMLDRWLVGRGIKRQTAATQLDVSVSMLHGWIHGSKPREESRERIARYTDGAIPAEAWVSR
jgi:hypothetical protein